MHASVGKVGAWCGLVGVEGVVVVAGFHWCGSRWSRGEEWMYV